MSELTLLLLRFGFLIVLWAFVFGVVYALRSDLFGPRMRRVQAESTDDQVFAASTVPPAAPTAPPMSFGTSSDLTQPISFGATPSTSQVVATRLVIVAGPKEGLEITLPKGPLTIGRSSESDLVIRDDYTSTHHARLMLWTEGWVIQDLDSTNGTFLDGTRVTLPTPIPLNTPVRIGTTSFELRR